MKKMLFALTAVSLLCFSACKKDDDTKAGEMLTASVNGHAYTATQTGAQSQAADAEAGTHLALAISSIDKDQNAFLLSIEFPHDELQAGTYALSADSYNSIMYTHADTIYASTLLTVPEGSIVLDHVNDHHADGSFSGTVVNLEGDRLIISEGKFSVEW